MNFTERIDRPELMDSEVFPVDEMRSALRFLGITNRFFDGSAVIVRHFESWSRAWNPQQPIRVLDVGTGGAEIPIAVVRWARERNLRMHVTAIDLVSEVASIARENTRDYPEITVLQKNVFDLEETTFDYVTASLLFHHVRPSESVRLLQLFDRLATRGIVISDLLRSRSSYVAVSALSYLIGNRIVRHDGPLSVRRAFHSQELQLLAQQAGLNYLRAQNEPWFRLSLAGQK